MWTQVRITMHLIICRKRHLYRSRTCRLQQINRSATFPYIALALTHQVGYIFTLLTGITAVELYVFIQRTYRHRNSSNTCRHIADCNRLKHHHLTFKRQRQRVLLAISQRHRVMRGHNVAVSMPVFQGHHGILHRILLRRQLIRLRVGTSQRINIITSLRQVQRQVLFFRNYLLQIYTTARFVEDVNIHRIANLRRPLCALNLRNTGTYHQHTVSVLVVKHFVITELLAREKRYRHKKQ